MNELNNKIEEMVWDAITDGVSLGLKGDGLTLNAEKGKVAEQTCTQLLALITEQVRLGREKRETELLDALYWMYVQYCSKGHDFMGAGETVSELLENAGYITVAGDGSIVKDNGDSFEQKSAQLKDSTKENK